MPFGVLYDRLAYTDALVNVSGIAIVAASLEYYRTPRQSWRGALLIGALAGIGYSFKSTFALFLWVPLLAAFFFGDVRRCATWSRLAFLYAVALVLPAISFFNLPAAPNPGINNLLVHHTSFFVDSDYLAEHPLATLLHNGELAWEYAGCYLSIPFTAVGLLAGVVLLRRRRREVWFLNLVFLVPLLIELIALWFVHSRYLFPLAWPLAVLAAMAISELNRRTRALAALSVAIPMAIGSGVLLLHPERRLHRVEVDEFLSSGPFSGYGISEAVAYLRLQAADGRPLTVLTDAAFGLPGDAIHAYLNLWNGIRVYDAWWLQLPDHPVLPKAATQVMRSQYERIPAATVDFPALPRVYYVTDTNYNTPADVARREPSAHLEIRFPKRGGRNYIDIYRLR
jgi:4-amino-4-deoxy-L-arabinose transferase-like glycosyltransferase